MVGVIFVYVDTVCWFYGYSFIFFIYFFFFLGLIGCFSMIIWTPIVLSVLYACVLYFCICTCSALLSMFHMERRSRTTLIIIIIIIIIIKSGNRSQVCRPRGGRLTTKPSRRSAGKGGQGMEATVCSPSGTCRRYGAPTNKPGSI